MYLLRFLLSSREPLELLLSELLLRLLLLNERLSFFALLGLLLLEAIRECHAYPFGTDNWQYKNAGDK